MTYSDRNFGYLPRAEREAIDRQYGVANIAQGHAVVGQQIAGRPADGVEVFAWLIDKAGHAWLLAGLGLDGEGRYSLTGTMTPDAVRATVLADGRGPLQLGPTVLWTDQ